jgi:hypothetical protein
MTTMTWRGVQHFGSAGANAFLSRPAEVLRLRAKSLTHNRMSTIKEIEAAIAKLSPQEIAQLRTWFQEFDAEAWDQQLESDAANGKLDAFYDRVQRENAGEPAVPLHDFLDDKKLS